MTLTVSEIADRIAEPGEHTAVIIGRLRHWTAQGLLAPSGEENPGTGRSRLYDDAGLQDAMLLNALADMGQQISTMRIALAVASQIRTEWGKAKAKRHKTLFLQIDFRPGEKPLPRLHWGGDKAFRALGFKKSIVINLTDLFSRLKTEKE